MPTSNKARTRGNHTGRGRQGVRRERAQGLASLSCPGKRQASLGSLVTSLLSPFRGSAQPTLAPWALCASGPWWMSCRQHVGISFVGCLPPLFSVWPKCDAISPLGRGGGALSWALCLCCVQRPICSPQTTLRILGPLERWHDAVLCHC